MRFLIGLITFIVVIASVALLLMMPWLVVLVLLVLLALWMSFTRRGQQAASVTAVGVSTLAQRAGSSAVIVVGIAGVVAVLVAMLAMAEGYRETLRRTGSEDVVIVMRGGSSAEVASTIVHDSVVVISGAPGIAKDDAGKPIVSPELVVAANLPVKGSSDPDELGSVQFRGIGEEAWKLRANAHIVEGRKFEPGKYELVAGKGAQRQFAGLVPGKEIRIGSQKWTVVGIFETHDALESELWADQQIVGPAYRRGSSVSSVFARLAGTDGLDQLKAALAADPRLQADVDTTLNYFTKQSAGISKLITIMGMVVGAIMAIGAVFGALNTMFAAVATRAREIATLRAIGFRGLPVVVAVMLETMLLAVIGGALGGFIAWLLFNGYTASTMGGGVGQLTFEFKVTPELLWTGIKWALAIGFIGGLYPALRAARLPVTTALRES